MAAVAWRYPQDDADKLEASLDEQRALVANATPIGVSVDKLNFNYGVAIVHGRPQWVPTQVFDDGHKTFIRFPEAMLDREAPGVLRRLEHRRHAARELPGEKRHVRRRSTLRGGRAAPGQQDQEIVRIIRTR